MCKMKLTAAYNKDIVLQLFIVVAPSPTHLKPINK